MRHSAFPDCSIHAIGGPSVRPPMPVGVLEVAYRAKWEESKGPDRYRRGIYTLLQRSVPYPQLANFDAPGSLVSCSRRTTSTTPLQSLNLLNDPVFLEAAEALAARVIREGRTFDGVTASICLRDGSRQTAGAG